MFIEKPASKMSYSKRSTIHSFGINDADYLTGYREDGVLLQCPFYLKWRSMIKRCYSERSLLKNPRYKDCTVCDEWRLFSSFKKWMKSKDWEGKHLDKDIIEPGNNIYSPDKCLFVSHFINSLLVMDTSKNGAYPVGVSYNRRNKNFRATCSCKAELFHLGYFETPEEASNEYRKFKKTFFIKIANENKHDEKLYKGLIKHINLIKVKD